MNKIAFPGLNMELNISKIAFSIGSIAIYWYAIFIVSAIVISLLVLRFKKQKFDIEFDNVIDLIVLLIPISIICARIYYVMFKLDYYLQNPVQIFNLRNGGLAIYGGIIGGILVCYLFCKKKKISFIDLLDYLAPSLALRTKHRKMG